MADRIYFDDRDGVRSGEKACFYCGRRRWGQFILRSKALGAVSAAVKKFLEDFRHRKGSRPNDG